MNPKLLAVLPLIALKALTATPAFAQETDKWTLSGSIGVNKQFDGDIGIADASPDADYNAGFAANVALGRDLFTMGPGQWRGELEGFYRQSNLDNVAGFSNADGDLNQFGLATNLVYEFSEINAPIKPYFGGGVGLSSLKGEFTGVGPQSINDRDATFMYQLFGGLRYELSDRVDLFTDARFVDANSPRFEIGADRFATQYDGITTSVGLRYRFGQ